MTKLTVTVIGFLLLATVVAQATEFEFADLSGTRIPHNRVEITMSKDGWQAVEKQVAPFSIEEILCTGSERMILPASGECPDVPGYVTIGFAACTQTFDVPRQATFKEIAPGWVRMVCTLDYGNAVALGQPECDYSRCLYVEEPTFLSPQMTIE